MEGPPVPLVGRNQEVVVHRVLYVDPWDPSQGLEGLLPPLSVQHQGESFALQTKSQTPMVKGQRLDDLVHYSTCTRLTSL